jgi:predicted nucleic acid-binding protein
MNDDFLFFVDTNVIVYSRDISDGAKHPPAVEWLAYLWGSRTGRISFQVLQEFYVTVTRKLKPGLPPEIAREDIRNLMAWKPLSPGKELFENAWRIQDRYGFSWWDSLIVSAASDLKCRFLLSEDLQSGQRIDSLSIVNPFEFSPDEIHSIS